MLYFTHGPKIPLSVKYNKTRDFILKNKDHSHFILIKTSGKPENTVKTQHDFFPQQDITLFWISIYGIEFAFDLQMNLTLKDEAIHKIKKHYQVLNF